MSALTQLADAVVTELAAGTFSLPFTPVRSYVPTYELSEMGVLHVTVVPRSLAIAGGTRGKSQHDCQVDIGVQQKFSKGDPLELDPLMDLVQELIDFLRARPLGDFPEAAWVRTQNEPIYSIEHYDQLRQFTSVVTLTYRFLR